MALTEINSLGIKDSEVKTADIAADAINGDKIADDAVGSEHIEQLDANLSFADSVSASFGAGADLLVNHDGTNNYIGTQNGNILITKVSGTEKMVQAVPDGTVELYDDNSKKLETTNTGIDVTGEVRGDDITIEKASGNLSSNFIALDGLGTLEIGGSSGAFIDLKSPHTDDFDLRIDNGGTINSVSTLQINTNGAERMRLDNGGDVFIGTTSTSPNPGIWFDQAGVIGIGNNAGVNTQSFLEFRRSATQIGSVTQSGTTGVSFNTSSDYRLKENQVVISDGITRLKTLKPYRFNFKADSSTTVDGFFAHEVTAVPEAITGTKDKVDEDNNPIYQQIDQSKLVPLLTAALQEAIGKIEVLETKVAALEGS